MPIATTITDPRELLEPAPELDSALARWTTDAELDAFAERERALDGWLFVAYDRGESVDLDAMIAVVES